MRGRAPNRGRSGSWQIVVISLLKPWFNEHRVAMENSITLHWEKDYSWTNKALTHIQLSNTHTLSHSNTGAFECVYYEADWGQYSLAGLHVSLSTSREQKCSVTNIGFGFLKINGQQERMTHKLTAGGGRIPNKHKARRSETIGCSGYGKGSKSEAT